MQKLIFRLYGMILFLIAVVGSAESADWQTGNIDPAYPVFTDCYPREALLEQPIPVPRGGRVIFLAVTRSEKPTEVRFSFAGPPEHLGKQPFTGTTALHDLIPVHVEGNHQGVKNYPDGAAPEHWKPHFIREAPFDLLEAVDNAPHDRLHLESGKTGGVLAEIAIPEDVAPGFYQGNIIAQCGSGKRLLRYSFEVFPIRIPPEYFIDSMHWLWIEPENLTSGTVPEYWSEAHWQLIEQAGRQLRHAGDNVIFTPHIFGKVPLIPTVQENNGRYRFDFTGFRRWLQLFDRLGFRGYVGTHLHSWMLPLHIRCADGKTRELKLDDPERLEVLRQFLPQLHAELQHAGCLSRYRQHVMDEPTDSQISRYRDYVRLLRETMPGVRNIDATIRTALYPDVDVAVIHLQKLRFGQALNAERKKRGQEFWIYSSCDPRPPFPNRQLDHPAAGNRLYPLLAFKYRCTGYLNWAANVYRGADEYENSLGPYPNGSQNPGHPPGDAWFFYRGPDGLRTGLRQLHYREGMVDTALLRMLAQESPQLADELLERVYFPAWEMPDHLNIYAMPFAGYSGRAFATEPAPYHALRRRILQLLSHQQTPTQRNTNAKP